MLIILAAVKELDDDLSGCVIDVMSPEYLQGGIKGFRILSGDELLAVLDVHVHSLCA